MAHESLVFVGSNLIALLNYTFDGVAYPNRLPKIRKHPFHIPAYSLNNDIQLVRQISHNTRRML